MTETVGSAVIRVSADSSELKSEIEGAKRSVKSLGAELGTSVQEGSTRAQRSIDAYISKLQLAAANTGKSASEIRLVELAQRGATQAQLDTAKAALQTLDAYKQQQAELRKMQAVTSTADAIKRTQQASAALGATNKLTAFQTQQLSFQLNDLFVQIASGQSPLTAIIQQGSQLSGTFGGIGGAVRAVLSVFSVARVAIGGSVAALAGLGVAAYQGSEDARKLANAISLTGNAAGVTADQVVRMSRDVAASTKTTVGSARETVQALVASGRFTSTTLGTAANAAQLFAKATGQSTAEVVSSFVTLSSNVAKGAEDLNKQYNFLTSAQLQQIRLAEDQGDAQKALGITLEALSVRVADAAQNVGVLERAWNAAAGAVDSFVQSLKAVGRAPSLSEQIEQARAARDAAQRRQGEGPTFNPNTGTLREGGRSGGQTANAAEDRVASLVELERLQKKMAEAQGNNAVASRAQAEFDKLREFSLTKQEKLTRDLAAANAIADKAGISQVEREKVLANIREKYTDKGGASKAASEAAARQKAQLSSDLSDIQNALRKQTDIFRNAESLLEAQRQAGLVGQAEYYARKRKFIEDETDAQVASLEQENARLAAQKGAAKDRIDLDKQIADNQAKILSTREKAGAQLAVLSIQQQANLTGEARAFDAARNAAEQYLEALERNAERELQAMALSDKEADRARARNQIDDKYREQRARLAEDLRRGQLGPVGSAEAQDKYDRELALIDEFNKKALASTEGTFQRIDQLQASAGVGASRAIQNYLDGASNVAKLTEDLVTRTFGGLEDAIVTFVRTGKVNFKSLADTIITEIVRIQVRAAIARAAGAGNSGGGFLDILSAFLSLGSGGGVGNAGFGDYSSAGLAQAFGRAGGGQVQRNNFYRVNEDGPELLETDGKQYLMMGSRGGNVVPNSQLGGEGGWTIINQTTARIDRAQEVRLPDGDRALIISEAAEMAYQRTAASLSDANSRTSRAMSRNFRSERAR